jgi:SH3-like domain-containing protein
MLAEPSEGAKLRFRAEAGVVGRIEKCRDGWCRFTVGKREGYLRTGDLWGVAPGDVVE